MKSRGGQRTRTRIYVSTPLGGTGTRHRRQGPTCMLLIACQKIPARSSEASVYVVQDYDDLGVLARSVSSRFELRLDPAARAAGPCASPHGDCQWSGSHDMGRGKKPGGGGRTGGCFRCAGRGQEWADAYRVYGPISHIGKWTRKIGLTPGLIF